MLLVLPQPTLYYQQLPMRVSMLQIMSGITELYLDNPCNGRRRMVAYLTRAGIPMSRDRVRNLMPSMGLRAMYQKPRTTVPSDPSKRFDCLVDLKEITAVDQVWATDIT